MKPLKGNRGHLIAMSENAEQSGQSPFLIPKDVSEFDTKVLIESFEIGDIDSIQHILGIGRREASRLLVRFRESKTGAKIRETFCTPDSRILTKRILSVLGSYAVTPIGRNALGSLVPFSGIEDCEERLRSLGELLSLCERLEDKRIDELKKILAEAKFAKAEAEKPLVIAVADEEEKSQFLRKYGSHVRVELAESEAKVRGLMAKESHLLTTLNMQADRGVTKIAHASSAVDVCPQAVINYYAERGVVLRCFQRIAELLGEFPLFSELRNELEPVDAVVGLLHRLQEAPVSLEDQLLEAEEEVNDEIKRLRSRNGVAEELRQFIEDQLLELENRLNLDRDEAELLREAAFEAQSIPFAFSASRTRLLRTGLDRRRAQERYVGLRNLAQKMEENHIAVEQAVRRVFEFDEFLSIAKFAEEYQLTIPMLNSGSGIGFEAGRNLFLVQDKLRGSGDVEPVSYSIGGVSIKLFGAETQPLVILTGANSGGKTTLLETLATVHILALLGLPVPANRADVPFVPVYIFRRRTARKVGSLEYAIRVLRPVMSRHKPKLLLMDEFEALTEPGALGRIIASLLNDLPKGSLTLFVTHLAREILPYLRTPVRVDGIEAKGIDEKGNLVVDRQPVFIHLGTSTPELIISKLAKKTKSKRLQKVYQNMIELLETRSPIAA